MRGRKRLRPVRLTRRAFRRFYKVFKISFKTLTPAPAGAPDCTTNYNYRPDPQASVVHVAVQNLREHIMPHLDAAMGMASQRPPKASTRDVARMPAQGKPGAGRCKGGLGVEP